MFGDCQVMSSMGGSMMCSDTLFSSPPSAQNPSFNFLPFQHFPSFMPKEENGAVLFGGKEEIMEHSGSGSDLPPEDKSGNENEISPGEQPPKKKRYHRHTARQIQEMEALFKECPHPDDKQRLRLSQELGLKPRQVKFWFQNRRTQQKAQQDRADNVLLRAENENLRNDNFRLQAELRSLVCPNCGSPAVPGSVSFEEIRLENARLREELERVCCMISRMTGPMQTMMAVSSLMAPPSLELDMNVYPRHLMEPLTPCTDMMTVHMLPGPAAAPPNFLVEDGGSTIIIPEEEKSMAMQLAESSLDQLVRMCQENGTLWTCKNGNYKLNIEEHAKLFPSPENINPSRPRSGEFRVEASRDSAVVIMNGITLVDSFLDAKKWMDLFPSIVARAKAVQTLSAAGHVSGPSESLHLMFAEFQAVSPLVQTREAYFFRYCKQNPEEGSWAVVDFPADGNFSCFNTHNNIQLSFPYYKRRPSGFIIQDIPNGYSRVTWVEHVEIDEEKPVHEIFSPMVVHTGSLFGAQRWLGVLQRQCERVASLMARNITDLGVMPSLEARKNMMRLGQRMIRTFCYNMSTSNGQLWTALPDSSEDNVRITTRKMAEAGQPHGLILCAVSTTWLPYPHHQVFDLLRDENRRSQWEILSNGNALNEVAHIANGSHPGNCISLLRINVSSNSSQNLELMLQETSTDNSGSLVVFSTVDVDSVQVAMNGDDTSYIPLLPVGFFITPGAGTTSPTVDGTSSTTHQTSGCLLTVGLQVLASSMTTTKINLSSVAAIKDHLCHTINQITTALTTTSPTCPENGTHSAVSSE